MMQHHQPTPLNSSHHERLQSSSIAGVTASLVRTPRATIRASPSIHVSTLDSTRFTCPPALLSVLAWSVTLLLISSCLGVADAGIAMHHPLGKRSYLELGCKGVWDQRYFARLDRVCEDCYNLFREPALHTLCRKDCFTTFYFKGCVEALLLTDEMEDFKLKIKQLHGADPGV